MKKPSAVLAYVVFEMICIIHRVIIAGLVLINTGYADAEEGDSGNGLNCRNNKYCSYVKAFYVTGAAYLIESGKKLHL